MNSSELVVVESVRRDSVSHERRLWPWIGATAIFSVFITAGTCFSLGSSGCGGEMASSIAPAGASGAIGLTSPKVLYTYDGHPLDDGHKYCAAGADLLKQIETQVMNANSNGPVSCEASREKDTDLTVTVKISCWLGDYGDDCKYSYGALMWTESLTDSTSEYDLLGYSWLRVSCPGKRTTYKASNLNVIRDAGKRSSVISNILDECDQSKQPPTPATSTDAGTQTTDASP